ncbi:hemin uptake protein HemP [Pseudoxanthobacter sp. M-2]|uniref:hemin uptake protein HemP n=1 Tax=Pseudoxanthobacter sp. M-2 TaxID=3078754 RepID=UPI0038FC015E
MTKDNPTDAAVAAPTDRPLPRPATSDGMAHRPTGGSGGRPARWDVAALCGDTGEAILVHKGEHYRLRVTARGRLILTK